MVQGELLFGFFREKGGYLQEASGYRDPEERESLG